jgi:DNA-binding transcriptional ArsR family regulator
MNTDPDVAELAALVTEPARAAMLMHMLDGRSWTATELARAAGVGAPTASAHLRKLLEAQLIRVSPAGRHRYFRIANADTARLLEQLARLAPKRRPEALAARRASADLRRCRLCYDHLAGHLGVAITQHMVQSAWLLESEPWYRVTERGRRALGGMGVEGCDGRTCMDWSERRLHVAGALGREIAQVCMAKRWLVRNPKSRALWITPLGAESLGRLFDLRFSPSAAGVIAVRLASEAVDPFSLGGTSSRTQAPG